MSEIEWTIWEQDRNKPMVGAVSVSVFHDNAHNHVHIATFQQPTGEVDYDELHSRVGPYLTLQQVSELIDVLNLIKNTSWRYQDNSDAFIPF